MLFIIENETEKLIGNISLMNIDNVQQTAFLHMLDRKRYNEILMDILAQDFYG